MTWNPVQSELTGRICYCANYQNRGSGFGRIAEVLENEDGERVFLIWRATPYGGRYVFPQKAEVWDEEKRVTRMKTIVRVPRNQEKLEKKVIFLNRDGTCHGRDRRLTKKTP